MKEADRVCHNVGHLTSIRGDVQRYKGQLVIKCNQYGTSYDNIPGGDYHKQGGIVFASDEIALELLNKLQAHFDNHKITPAKEVYSWTWKLCKAIALRVRVHFIKRKWKKDSKKQL